MTSFLKSFTYAFKGLVYSFKQRNMKIIFFCAFLTVIAALLLKVNTIDWCILLMCIGITISLELINSAIENLVDIVSPDYNEKAGRIKDMSAGAVLVASIISFIIGLIILGKYFLQN